MLNARPALPQGALVSPLSDKPASIRGDAVVNLVAGDPGWQPWVLGAGSVEGCWREGRGVADAYDSTQ